MDMEHGAVAFAARRFEPSSSLTFGAHRENDAGTMCAMEAVSRMAGEAWSDRPACVCPRHRGLHAGLE